MNRCEPFLYDVKHSFKIPVLFFDNLSEGTEFNSFNFDFNPPSLKSFESEKLEKNNNYDIFPEYEQILQIKQKHISFKAQMRMKNNDNNNNEEPLPPSKPGSNSRHKLRSRSNAPVSENSHVKLFEPKPPETPYEDPTISNKKMVFEVSPPEELFDPRNYLIDNHVGYDDASLTVNNNDAEPVDDSKKDDTLFDDVEFQKRNYAGNALRTIDVADVVGEKPRPKTIEYVDISFTIDKLVVPVTKGSLMTIFFKLNDDKSLHIYDYNTRNSMLFVTRKSGVKSTQFNIKADNGNTVGYVVSNFSRSEYLGILNTGTDKKEISAVSFKGSSHNASSIQKFTVYLPDAGVQFTAGERSVLMKAATKVKKYVPKPPKFKGGIPVLRFGGKVKMESKKNFILVESDNHESFHLIFGKESENEYVCDVYEPLTPLQAVTICLTMFK